MEVREDDLIGHYCSLHQPHLLSILYFPPPPPSKSALFLIPPPRPRPRPRRFDAAEITPLLFNAAKTVSRLFFRLDSTHDLKHFPH